MTIWQKLFASAVFAIAILPSPMFAQRYRPTTNMYSSDLVLVSLETPPSPDVPEDIPPASVEKSGALSTKDGQRLNLKTDLGSVHIFTDGSGNVSYRVLVEVDPRNPGAQEFLQQFVLAARQTPLGIVLTGQLPWRTFRGRVRVNYEIHIPRHYGIHIETGAGDIDVQNINGHVGLATGDGNITVGAVSAGTSAGSPPGSSEIAAQLETQGGHITIGDVAGSLQATTSGGHITTGDINGDCALHTGGGHIRTGRISGVATLDTGGGNIHIASTVSGLTANTAGGQIDLGEAAGAIRAQTNGGALRIERTSGPTTIESSGGNIFVRQVDGPLRASTLAGTITASFNAGFVPEPAAKGAQKISSASQLSSGEGDIIVYLNRDLPVTIDALVDRSNGHSIIADRSLPLKIDNPNSGSGPHAVRFEGSLNGGGEAIHLKASSGNIVLKLGDTSNGMNASFSGPPLPPLAEPVAASSRNSGEDQDANDASGFIEEMFRRVQESWWGGIPVDSDELQKHLEHSVKPAYPQVARDAGIEGDVVLRAYISSEGRVTDLRVLAGPPILARAAIEAVQQWRYQPIRMNGHPVSVVTTLVVTFRLQ